MIEEQTTHLIATSDLLAKVTEVRDSGHRLVQVSCIRKPEHFELNYTFDKDFAFINYRIELPADKPVVPSITGIYWSGFTYENEIHDLFGVQVEGINIDFKGTFYRTQIATPFAAMPNVKIVAKKES